MNVSEELNINVIVQGSISKQTFQVIILLPQEQWRVMGAGLLVKVIGHV